MARKEFILQGFTRRTHVEAVRELFDVQKVERAILSVAFVTSSGVELLKDQISGCAGPVTVFAGIRNDLTSRQGLGLLRDLGTRLYAVDTGSRNVIFHPKLFMVRGKRRARVIVGSANLTLGGMHNNIEAGMLLDFDLQDEHDKGVVDAIEASFQELPKDYPEHVLKIASTATLDDMQASGRLVDEMALPPPRPGTKASPGSTDTVPRIVLKLKPLRKALKAAKKAAAKPPKTSTKKKGTSAAPAAALASIGVEYELVWQSKALTRRDLTIPTATGTHATGSINLDKGLLGESVDQRHYFRDDVFDNLSWSPTPGGTVEETYAKFLLVLKGISYGEFDLRIAHSTSTTNASYLQSNAMTRLSWGPMRTSIARADLIGRTLAMYRDLADPKRFVLEID